LKYSISLSKHENTELVKQMNSLREQLRILNRQVANQQQLISEIKQWNKEDIVKPEKKSLWKKIKTILGL
jgi:peptidoglycan hydrolase CwlO-like protein